MAEKIRIACAALADAISRLGAEAVLAFGFQGAMIYGRKRGAE